MKPSANLKRRTPAPAPPVEELSAINEQDEEPPLKKFKALFDASDPDKMAVDQPSLRDVYNTAVGESAGLTQGSATQSDSRPLHTQLPPTLEVVAEEEEESIHSQAKPTRHTSPLSPETQVHVDESQGSGAKRKAPSKAKPQPPQSRHMDSDPAFLTAIASKKGKKTGEDDFDREFNKLRISKPDIHREGEEQAWEILGDFDTESKNIRGNFMVIIDLEVFRPSSGRGDVSVVRRTYDGVQNFKKFKKVRVVDVIVAVP